MAFWFAAGLQGAGWQAGAAKADITPVEPVWMAGYGSRTKPMEGVRQRIWAKALALRDGSGETSALVTLDLCDIDRIVAGRLASRILARVAIPRERLLLNTSHSHSAPLFGSADNYLHLMGADPAPYLRAVERYTRFAEDRIVQAVADAVAALQPATLHFGQGFAGIAVNRRRVWKRELPGPVDHDVPVLAARSLEGHRLIAVVAGYACHSTVLGDYQIGGDWPGYAQEAIESAAGAGSDAFVALFVQGAGGDANPLPRRTVQLARRHGEALADAVAEVLHGGRMRALAGPLRAAFDHVDLRFQMPSREALEKQASGSQESDLRRHARRLLARLNQHGSLPSSHPYPVQAWRFGPELTLVALGGELVADYALRFKNRYGWGNTWIAGYSNDVFAYIPSRRVLGEGGYEGETAMHWDGHAGPFTEDVEETIAAKVHEVIGKVTQ